LVIAKVFCVKTVFLHLKFGNWFFNHEYFGNLMCFSIFWWSVY
jgi:hypothetical protein